MKFWIFNLPTLLRLTWFPLALLSVTTYYWIHWNSLAEIALIEARESAATADVVLLPLLQTVEGTAIWLTLQLIALSAAAVAVHRFIVDGDRKPGEFFSFAFGKPERAYFAMGVIAHILMIALIAGQYAAQLTWPDISTDTIISVARPYADLGPWALSMFAFPGELPIFEMLPLNYALWAALVIATFALIIRIAPWPALAATEENAPLRHTLALTHGRTLTTVVYVATIGALAALALALLGIAGFAGLALAGFQDLASILSSLAGDGAGARHANIEIQSVLDERRLALYQEIVRFIAGLVGVTLGATIVSHLYLTLRNEPA